MFDLFRSRDKAVRITLTALLGLVALSMVTYLIPTSGTDTGSGADQTVVATIGKVSLTSQQVSRVIQNMTQNRQLPPELLSIYVPQIVQQMITDRAMEYEANRLGIRVSADETDNAIIDQLPAELVKNGKIDAATLNAVLQQQGVSMADLKSDTQRQLMINRLRQIVDEGVVVSPREILEEFHRKNDKIQVQYALLSPAQFQSQAEPTDAEIKAYYDAHKASFQTPEKHDLAVIVLDPAKLNIPAPADAALQREYNANIDKYKTPERVMARHILIKTDGTTDAAAKEKAESILKQIQAGGDFAKLAKENSQDPGSAAMGGELGWIVKGQTVPEFEKAAFSLQPGQTSGLVKTTYGYHIIQVEKHEQAHVQSFDDVKGQLIADYMKRAQADAMQAVADKVGAELRKDPMHPELAAQLANTNVVTVNNYQAGDPIPGIGVSKEVANSVAPLRKGEVTEPIPVTGDKVVIAEVTDYEPAHQATLEESKTEVRNKAQEQKLQDVLNNKAKELLAKAQSMGGDLEKAGKEMGIEIKTSPDVNRQGVIEGIGSAGLLSDAFSKPVGALIGPLAATGGRVIAKVVEKVPADSSELAAQESSIRQDLKQQKERDRATMFEAGLKRRLEEQGKLKIHQDVVTRLVQSYSQRS